MKAVSRTAQCSKCGGVIFTLKPLVGKVMLRCSECGVSGKTLNLDKYKSVSDICNKCGGKTFKFWINVDKGQSQKESWRPKCINCNEAPKIVCINEKGVIIDELQRELLIRNDIIEEIKNEILEKSNIIENLEYKNEEKYKEINYLESEIEEKYYNINRLNDEVYRLKREIDGLEMKNEELEREISFLRY